MYEVFGNFDSVEELNACAAGLLAEGDTDNLARLAEENGIPGFFVENYIAGNTEELTDWMNAAIGKLDVEASGHEDRYVPVQPVADYLKGLCGGESFARIVRHRTKSVASCMKYVEEQTGKLVAKGINHAPDLQVFHWARDYFLEEGKKE